MAYLNWDESLSVKVNSIDLQHKKLFEMINEFYDNMKMQSGKDNMAALLSGMKDYAVIHFSMEERLMKMCNYVSLDRHKAEHDKFVETVNDFEERFLSGKLLVTLELTNFLKEWIVNHIMGTDKQYSAIMIKNGIK